MARRLTAPRPPGRRRAAFAVLVAAVLLLHAAATHEIGARLAAADADAAMPPRIAVAYLRTLEPTAPAVVAVPAAPPTAPRAPRAPREPRVAKASEAAEPAASAASAPVVEAAASEPAVEVASAAPEAASEAVASAPGASDAAPTAEPRTDAVAAAPFAVGASAPPGADTFTWPDATRIRYVLTGNYRGAVDGHAEVEWIRQGPRYQVNVDLVVGPSFAPLISRRATSEGLLTDRGLAPDRYDETTRVLMTSPRSSSIRFWPESVVLVNNRRVDRLAGTQDSASQFVQFSWLFGVRPELLRVGNSFEVPLALPRSLDTWRYEVDAEDTLQTPFGPLATFHLKPRRRLVKKPGEVAVEMWLAPTLRYLPVRIRFEQNDDNWVDLMIAGKPELS